MRVEPITEIKHLRSIKRLLADSPRDRLLLVSGINSGLRVQDLLGLRVKDLTNRKVGDRVLIKEKKTGKENVFILNKEIAAAFQEFLQKMQPEPDHFIFKSRKGINAPLTTHRVTKMVKFWCSEINLNGNFGAHTLRKTWCYVQRTKYGVSWEVLSKRLNHSSPSITRRYLGVKEEEVEKVLLNAI